MASRIEEYALIGDTHTAALVASDGSMDWLCLPRFDSGAVFAALLGTERHGRWLIAPSGGVRRRSRRYWEDTLVLQTDFETDTGEMSVIDCMPHRHDHADVVRLVRGRRGHVPVRMQLVIRFDYGSIVPWVRRAGDSLTAIGGPDALCLRTEVETTGEDLTTVADFTVRDGETVPFTLTWHRSHEPAPERFDATTLVDTTAQWWRDWAARCRYTGPWRDAVVRSLITLKALSYEPTGGIVAAPTTSLPEQLGGIRNWDYRFCWLRDASLTLYSLMLAGYEEEARAWREWLLRAVAGDPADLQIMYGPAGERRLTELELPWLPGHEGSVPVRIGNAASAQFQLDVYGEVMDALHRARLTGIEPDVTAWRLQHALVEYVEDHWSDPDEGIWEVRGSRRHFTHSKVMAWVAIDRAVKAVELFGLDGPIDRWRALRDRIHAEVCEHGYDSRRNTFTQYYGSRTLDASLLLMPLVGFLEPADPRVKGTVEAIQTELCRDGFVLRYPTDAPEAVDGLPPGEGAFLAATFWLCDNLALLNRQTEAESLFGRLLDLRNDVGLLAEEYDPQSGRLVGNFPQAFSHVGLVNTAFNLTAAMSVARHHPSA